MRRALTAGLLVLLVLPGPAQAKPGLVSRLLGSRILNPVHWNGGYPRGSRVVSRRPDALDEGMLERSYFFDRQNQVQRREVLTVRLIGNGLPLDSGESFGSESSVSGVDTHLWRLQRKLDALGLSASEFHTLDVRHTHPGIYEPHRHHFSPQDREASLRLRQQLDGSSVLRHLALRESIVYEKGPARKLVTRVKTYELPPGKGAPGP